MPLFDPAGASPGDAKDLLGTVVRVPVAATSPEELATNKAIARLYFDEVMTKGNMSVIDELFAEDFVSYGTDPTEHPGREGFRLRRIEGWEMLNRFWTSFRWEIEDLVGEGNLVAARSTFVATRPRLPEVRVLYLTYFRIEGGRIQQLWATMDNTGPKRATAGFRSYLYSLRRRFFVPNRH